MEGKENMELFYVYLTVYCKCFQFGHFQNLVICERVKKTVLFFGSIEFGKCLNIPIYLFSVCIMNRSNVLL